MDPTPKSVLGLERATSSSPMGRHRCHSLGLALLLSRMVTNRFLQHGSCTDKRRQKDAAGGVRQMTRWMTLDRKVKIVKGEDAHFNDLGGKRVFLYPRETQAPEAYSCTRHKNRRLEDSYRGDDKLEAKQMD